MDIEFPTCRGKKRTIEIQDCHQSGLRQRPKRYRLRRPAMHWTPRRSAEGFVTGASDVGRLDLGGFQGPPGRHAREGRDRQHDQTQDQAAGITSRRLGDRGGAEPAASGTQRQGGGGRFDGGRRQAVGPGQPSLEGSLGPQRRPLSGRFTDPMTHASSAIRTSDFR